MYSIRLSLFGQPVIETRSLREAMAVASQHEQCFLLLDGDIVQSFGAA